MDRYGIHTKTEAVDLALRHLAGQPMTREEALAIRALGRSGSLPTSPARTPLILADTSAWVEYDRATGSAVDQRLTDRFNLLSVDVAADFEAAARMWRYGATLLVCDADLSRVATVVGIPMDGASLLP